MPVCLTNAKHILDLSVEPCESDEIIDGWIHCFFLSYSTGNLLATTAIIRSQSSNVTFG